MAKRKMPAPRRAGTLSEKRAHLVRLMLEIASLDRDEYRGLRAEMWRAVARSHNRKQPEQLQRWSATAS